MNIKQPTTLRDALHNLSARENGDSHEYTVGLVVGVVSTMVALGIEYNEAVKLAVEHSPYDCHWSRVPAQMIEAFRPKIKKSTFPL